MTQILPTPAPIASARNASVRHGAERLTRRASFAHLAAELESAQHELSAIKEPILRDLIGVIDQLDDVGDQPAVALASSIQDQLLQILCSNDVIEIPVDGELDDVSHQVIKVSLAEAGDPTAIELLKVRRGYLRLGDVLRPAQVAVTLIDHTAH